MLEWSSASVTGNKEALLLLNLLKPVFMGNMSKCLICKDFTNQVIFKDHCGLFIYFNSL